MPTVDFARTLSVGSSPEEVWAVVTDVERVAGWVTVLGAVEELTPLSAYRATLTDRLGPFRLSADLEVDVVEAVTNQTIRFLADGEDRQVSSRIQIEARLSISAQGNRTNLKVEGHYEVTGRVATLGASMIKAKGDKILDEFFQAAIRELA
jgi:carbon monoxide dehydrogenase subunit G